MTRALSFIAFCLMPFLFAGCSAERMAVLQDRAENQRLGDSADLYWKALRWGDYTAAGSFIEDSEKRFEWLQLVEGPQARQYRSTEIVSVEAGPLLESPVKGVQRKGLVISKVVYYILPQQVLKTEMVRQSWVRKPKGWFIED